MSIDFVESSRKDCIFYSDFFRVNGKGCLILGSGKTKASREATNNNEFDEIALDSVCLTYDDKHNLYGHFEMVIRPKNMDDPIKNRVKVEYIAYMLSNDDTKEILTNKELGILEVDLSTFVKKASYHISFANTIQKFEKLTKDKKVSKYLLIPWRDSHKEKGILLKRYMERAV